MKKYDTYKDSGVEWIGEMPQEWSILQMKRGLTINNGKDYKDIQTDKGYPVIGSGGQFAFASQYLYDGEALLLGRKGTIDKPRYINDKFWTVDTMFYAVPNEDVCCKYMFYQSLMIPFRLYSTNTALPSITQKDLAENPMCYPSLSEQIIIAVYLDHKVSTIDKSVEMINAEIDDLKAYRQNLISEVVTKGLNPRISVKDSGVEWIGVIPEEWNVVPLKYSLSLKGRIGWKGLKSEEFEEQSYAYLVTGQDFKSDIVDWTKCYQISKERYDEDPLIQLKNGDILVTKDGTIGKVAKVKELDKPACLNSGIFVVRQTKGAFVQDYLYWVLTSNQLTEFVGFNNTGSTIQHLYQNIFENMPLTIPPLIEQQAIAAYLDDKTSKVDATIKQLEFQRDDLNVLKLSVISEAVTGKIDVRDWKSNNEQ